jgi:predicted MFS family arabinose efflux permease
MVMRSHSSSALPRGFLGLAVSNLAAQSAEQLSLAATPLVAVLALGAGPGEIGLLSALQTLPFLLLSLPLGALADKWPRRRLMLGAEGLRLVSLLVLIWILSMSGLSVAWLAVLGFLGAVGTVAFSVAAPGVVASLVPRALLPAANARLELARSVAFTAGPAAAGALVAWSGALSAYVLAGVLSAGALGLLLRLSDPVQQDAGRRRPLLRDVAEGARFVWNEPMLRPILITGVIFNISWFVVLAVYVPYAINELGLSTQAVGVTQALYGLGMVVGALLCPRLVAALPFGRAIQIGPVAGVMAAACLAATLLLPSAALAGACFFLLGAGPMVWTITTTTLRQSLVHDAMLGRVFAVFLTLNAGARPIGAALGGLIGSAWGERACLLVALAGFACQAGVILASGISTMRRLPEPAV